MTSPYTPLSPETVLLRRQVLNESRVRASLKGSASSSKPWKHISIDPADVKPEYKIEESNSLIVRITGDDFAACMVDGEVDWDLFSACMAVKGVPYERLNPPDGSKADVKIGQDGDAIVLEIL